jgi:hypothetical protein
MIIWTPVFMFVASYLLGSKFSLGTRKRLDNLKIESFLRLHT